MNMLVTRGMAAGAVLLAIGVLSGCTHGMDTRSGDVSKIVHAVDENAHFDLSLPLGGVGLLPDGGATLPPEKAARTIEAEDISIIQEPEPVR